MNPLTLVLVALYALAVVCLGVVPLVISVVDSIKRSRCRRF